MENKNEDYKNKYFEKKKTDICFIFSTISRYTFFKVGAVFILGSLRLW